MSASSGQDPHSARLGEAFNRADRLAGEPEIQADYARYLCVLVTGYLEQAVTLVILKYVDGVGDQRISRYVASTLNREGSMQASRILALVGRLDEGWHSQLIVKLSPQHREAIGSAYASRNKIAHGEDVDLTYRRVRDYYDLVREVVGFLEEVVQ